MKSRPPVPPRHHRRRAGGRIIATVLAGCLWVASAHAIPAPVAFNGEQGLLCRRAMQQAEVGSGLPQYMLAGIARVESGRPDPVSGHVNPWPWTVNAEGQGSFFPSKAEAITFVRQLQARGVQSIDVGCLQINLLNHPDAFHSLEEAFDPDANARYAVRFLTQLRDKTGSWDAAAAWYHSATPELGNPYHDRVVTAMAQEAKGPAYDTSSAFEPPVWPVAVASLPGMLAGHGRIIMLPRPNIQATYARPDGMVAPGGAVGRGTTVGRTSLASTNLPGMGLGGVVSGTALSVPQPGVTTAFGRGLAAYRMQPVAVVRPHLMASR
jgi:hypothetical protein